MQRKSFIKNLAFTGMAGATMKLQELGRLTNGLEQTATMPVLFLGHGSPMNAIEENEFVQGFRAAGKALPRPRAVLCISAHWETKGTWITAMEQPRTIHDFGGFPKALFDVQYPAPGSPEIAAETKALVTSTSVGLDQSWGLDHGSWTVLKHFYPAADVPIIQLSLDYTQPASYHYALARELKALRNKGVLITGSGNMVHNLGRVAWDKLNADNYGYDWALEASEKMKTFIRSGDHTALINYRSQGRAFDLSIPSPEHYLPLLYILALADDKDALSFFNDKAVGGSLTMTSVQFAQS